MNLVGYSFFGRIGYEAGGGYSVKELTRAGVGHSTGSCIFFQENSVVFFNIAEPFAITRPAGFPVR